MHYPPRCTYLARGRRYEMCNAAEAVTRLSVEDRAAVRALKHPHVTHTAIILIKPDTFVSILGGLCAVERCWRLAGLVCDVALCISLLCAPCLIKVAASCSSPVHRILRIQSCVNPGARRTKCIFTPTPPGHERTAKSRAGQF